jgi:hypothetical protein
MNTHRTIGEVKRRVAWLGWGLLVGLIALGARYLLGDDQNALSAAITLLIPVAVAFFVSFIKKTNEHDKHSK